MMQVYRRRSGHKILQTHQAAGDHHGARVEEATRGEHRGEVRPRRKRARACAAAKRVRALALHSSSTYMFRCAGMHNLASVSPHFPQIMQARALELDLHATKKRGRRANAHRGPRAPPRKRFYAGNGQSRKSRLRLFDQLILPINTRTWREDGLQQDRFFTV